MTARNDPIEIPAFFNFSLSDPIKKIPQEALDFILNGGKESFVINSKELGVKREYQIDYMGIESFIKEQLNNNESKSLRRWATQFVDTNKCESCLGSRLKIQSRYFKINQKNIFELTEMDLSELKVWFETLNKKLSSKELKISEQKLTLENLKELVSQILDLCKKSKNSS